MALNESTIAFPTSLLRPHPALPTCIKFLLLTRPHSLSAPSGLLSPPCFHLHSPDDPSPTFFCLSIFAFLCFPAQVPFLRQSMQNQLLDHTSDGVSSSITGDSMRMFASPPKVTNTFKSLVTYVTVSQHICTPDALADLSGLKAA